MLRKWIRIGLAAMGFIFIGFLCFVFLADLSPNRRTIDRDIVINVD